jgi:heptosyltransferase-2
LILVCREGISDFFTENKIVDQVLTINKNSSQSKIKGLVSELNSLEIRNVFSPHQSFRSAWILKNVSALNKISYKQWWNKIFFTHRIVRNPNLPEALRLGQLITAVLDTTKLRRGADAETRQILEPIINKYSNPKLRTSGLMPKIPKLWSLAVAPQRESILRAVAKLNIKDPFVIVSPGSQWLTKKWKKSGFVELAQALQIKGFNVYITGSNAEKIICKEIEALAAISLRSHGETQKEIISLANTNCEVRTIAGETSLSELHALLSRAQFAVTNDNGTMHLAAAASCPVVSIFGPTTLELGYRPWSDSSFVAQIDLPCRPCGRHGHNKCPLGTHDCMKKLTAHEVLQAVETLEAIQE